MQKTKTGVVTKDLFLVGNNNQEPNFIARKGDIAEIHIYTSYFASPKWHGYNVIAISQKTPIDIPIYNQLCPSWDLIMAYKKSHDQNQYKIDYYNQVLSRLIPLKVVNDLNNKIMLCYEKSGTFCHRHLIAEWLMFNVPGVIVKEL